MDETRITRTLELAAPAETVWRAITDPDQLGDWLGSSVELDLRPGGDGTVVETDGVVRRARVDEVDPARRLAWQWWPADGTGSPSTVELELEPTEDGTRVVVTETLAPSPSGSATASAAAFGRAGDLWATRFLLLGCCLVRAAVACR